jgi:hypothetical protein
VRGPAAGPARVVPAPHDSRTDQKELILLLLWRARAWTVHNNIVHLSGPVSVSESVHLLLCYQESLTEIRHRPDPDDWKGKRLAAEQGASKDSST